MNDDDFSEGLDGVFGLLFDLAMFGGRWWVLPTALSIALGVWLFFFGGL